jgi:dihydrofolate reductase
MTLDGFGSGPVGYWGKDGPELSERQERTFFAGRDQVLVLGANTYRLMAGFAEDSPDNPAFASLTASPKIVISRTLEDPLSWDNTTLLAGDAVEAVAQLKADSPVPLRSHGSISMNRSLLAAGLVDRLEVLVFPVITGASGYNPILAGVSRDVDLELVDSRLLDGRIQQLVYLPTVLAAPLGAESFTS